MKVLMLASLLLLAGCAELEKAKSAASNLFRDSEVCVKADAEQVKQIDCPKE